MWREVLRVVLLSPHSQGDLLLNVSEQVIEFVLKLALAAEKLDKVDIDSSSTLVPLLSGTYSTYILCQLSLPRATYMYMCILDVHVHVGGIHM